MLSISSNLTNTFQLGKTAVSFPSRTDESQSLTRLGMKVGETRFLPFLGDFAPHAPEAIILRTLN